jgi:hypothetical protein
MFIDDDAIGIAAVGDAAKVFVRRIKSESVMFGQNCSGHVCNLDRSGRVDHATDRDEIASFVLGNAEPALVTRPTISWPGTIG